MSDVWMALLAIAVLLYFIGEARGFARARRKHEQEARQRALVASAAPTPPDVTPTATNAPVRIGERFNYIGLHMLCTSHCIRFPMGQTQPGMTAEYRDQDGVVRSHYWTPDQFDAIRTELSREADSLLRG